MRDTKNSYAKREEKNPFCTIKSEADALRKGKKRLKGENKSASIKTFSACSEGRA